MTHAKASTIIASQLPVANWYEAAQRAAMIYSFFAICKKHGVNPFQWLKYTLENIMTINHKNLGDLYPQNYKKIVQQSNM